MLGITRIVLNAQIREIHGMTKRVDESVLQWFSHIERMGDDRIAKRVNVGG